MTENRSEKDELIEEIIRRTLDCLADWEPAKLMPGVGPQYPAVHLEFARRKSEYSAKVSALLSRKTIDELRSGFLFNVGSAMNPLEQREGIYFELASDLERLHKLRPPWFAGGWSVKAFRLEPRYWAGAHTVSIAEAALMLIGVEPRKVTYSGLFNGYGQDDRSDEVLYFLEDQFELLVRRFGDLAEDESAIPLANLCQWVAENGLSVSFELKEIMKLRGTPDPSEAGQVLLPGSDKPLHSRTREMFQRALIAAAVGAYDLREKKDSAKVAKAMANAGDFIGFSLDEKKLARQIRAGFSQIDDLSVSELREKGAEK